ncbi:MAG TPA: lamin tail domain-containing protein [Verrucomicrobiae bacterium]|nr:lamin tail domain-containing protein [Verrucomicrobiae bacterium]
MFKRSPFVSSLLAGFLIMVCASSKPAQAAGPVVDSQIPAANADLYELHSVEVFFDQDVTGVDATDLLVNGSPAALVNQVAPNQYLFTSFTQPSPGTVTISWAAGHGITDLAQPPNAFAGGSWTYHLDPALALKQVRINEFLTDNQVGIRDEDGTYQDWIELYNDSTISINLAGCFLTDTKLKLDTWRFPTAFIGAKDYLLVWASNKNRTNNQAALHTNFRLDADGEYLAFVDPQTNVVSAFDPVYPPQRADVSYGRDPQSPSVAGYYSKPTPRAVNSTTGSGSDFTSDVYFSREGGTYLLPFSVALSTASSNAVIRYVLVNNPTTAAANLTNVPGPASPIYTDPIPISGTVQIRARAFEAGKLPSTPVSITYIQISPALASFSSDIPVVLISTFGATLSASGDGTGYMMIFDNSLDRSSMTNQPDLATRIGVNDRGSSTANQLKNNLAVEMWDEFNQDADKPFLDMPPESDWVFYGINGFDPSLMHNAIFHWFGRNVGRYSSRTRYVEVFRKSDGGVVTTNDYYGLYLVEEKPKRNKNRVDIETLQPENTNAVDITGGYLLKIDRGDSDEATITLPTINGVRPTPDGIRFISPNLTPQSAVEPRRAAQVRYITSYLTNFVTSLTTPNWTNPVTGYRTYVDVPSWIDNLIMNLISFNVDGYRLSGYFFKDRGKRLEQGPPWDCDRCLGTGGSANTPQGDNRPWNPRVWRPYTTDINSDQGTDFFGRSPVGVSWFDRVFRDPDFWQAFIDRYQELRQSTFSDQHVLDMVEGFYQEIKEAQVRELARFGPPPIGPTTRGTFTWPRAGLQTVTFSAGSFSSTYAYNFGATNPLSGSIKVGYFTNEVGHQKRWLLDRLEFMDTNFLAKPTLSLPAGPVASGTTVNLAPSAKPGTIVYYTLDGTDPRLSGGAISPSALSSSSAVSLNVANTIRVFARCFNPTHANVTNATLIGNPPINSQWSGPAVATYYTSVPPLRITELMYHPANPPAGNTTDPDLFEYIEVRNTSAASLNVKGFKLSGGVQFVFPEVTLAAGQYGVVVKDATQFAARYGSSALVLGVYSNNLANSGDHVVLEGGLGEPILDFNYSDEWYPITDGAGFSLQIVDENAATDTWGLAASWRPSGVANGTPGSADPGIPAIPIVYVNEALTHTEPAPGDAIELFNPGGSPANIGGWYLTDNFNNPKKYRIPDGTTIPANGYLVFYESNAFGVGPNGFALSAKGEAVYVFSALAGGALSGYYHGFDFGAQADGVTFGRYVVSTGEDHFPAQATPTLGGPNSGPKVGPIVISEINYHPVDFLYPKTTVDNDVDEYIELYNLGGTPAPLYDPANPTNTWRLRDAVSYQFPTGVVLPAGGYLLVVSFTPTNGPDLDAFRAANGVPPSVPVYGPWSGKLDNTQDNVELVRPDLPDPPGTSSAGFVPYILVDKVGYRNTAPWPGGSSDGVGATIQRVSMSAYGNDPANWRAAIKSPGSGLATAANPPTITAQPADTVGIETYGATFSVSAAGDQPLAYQWLFNGQPIRGGIGPVLTLSNLRTNQTGQYSCVVLNAAGSVQSASAHLTVRFVARISQHPADVRLRGSTNVVDYGFTTNNATFNVSAIGTGPVRYQWRFNGVNLPGATSSTLTINNVGLTNDGMYDVLLTDDVAPVLSLPARLTVLIPPVFLEAPLNQTVVSNGSFSASVVVRGNPPPFRYEWREISTTRGAVTTINTTNYFAFGPVTNLVDRTWRLLVSNDAASTVATFIVTGLPDSDKDGIPDDWELSFGLDPNQAGDRNQDPDGDHMTNYEEYLAGTDPKDRLSNLRVDLTTQPGAALIRVGAVANRTYSIQYTDNLRTGPWSRLADLTAQSADHVEVVPDPGYTTNRFYRVVYPQQP